MSLTNIKEVTQVLIGLKDGSLLAKRKHNGERYFHEFFLDKHENFVSYHSSEKNHTHPQRCKYSNNNNNNNSFLFISFNLF